MRAFARSIGLALVALIATCEASLSQTIAETATKWGLLGAWRTDCNTPVSLSNGELRYAVKGGKLLHDREFGDRRDSSPVTSATIKPDGSLDIVIKYESISQTRELLLVKGSDGRHRSISNKNLDTGEYTIKDGKFTANGNITPWQSRCR